MCLSAIRDSEGDLIQVNIFGELASTVSELEPRNLCLLGSPWLILGPWLRLS